MTYNAKAKAIIWRISFIANIFEWTENPSIMEMSIRHENCWFYWYHWQIKGRLIFLFTCCDVNLIFTKPVFCLWWIQIELASFKMFWDNILQFKSCLKISIKTFLNGMPVRHVNALRYNWKKVNNVFL